MSGERTPGLEQTKAPASATHEPDHAALGDEDDVLAELAGASTAEGDVLDLRDEALVLALAHDPDAPVLDGELCAGREIAGEDDPLGVGRDVDEAPRAGRHVWPHAELRDVDRAIPADLQEGEERGVEASALEIGELVGRRHDGFGIGGAAELEIEQGHAADRSLLDDPGGIAMRSNSQARSAAKSAPLIPFGVLIGDCSARRNAIDTQRDAIGASTRCISVAR